MKRKSVLPHPGPYDTQTTVHESSAPWLFDKRIDSATDEWLTAKEAAEYLKLSIGSLRNMTCNGTVESYRIGSSRRVRYLKSELRDLLLKSKKGGLSWQ